MGVTATDRWEGDDSSLMKIRSTQHHGMKLVWSCGFVSFPTAGLLRDAFFRSVIVCQAGSLFSFLASPGEFL
jgi:hypothetical protein